MSDKFTEITTPNGGLGEWGHVDPTAAIEALRAHYERERNQAAAVLADIDEGRVEVFHQRGPRAGRDRCRVWPAATTTSEAS